VGVRDKEYAMVVKIKKRNQEPPINEETGYDLGNFLKHIFDDDSWPELNEADVTEEEQEDNPEQDVKVTQIIQHQSPRGESQKVAVWTMAGVIGVVTTYGIAVGDRQVLMTALMVAALLMVRLFGRTRKQPRGGKQDGEESNTGNRGSG
jgi:hypothetical protein